MLNPFIIKDADGTLVKLFTRKQMKTHLRVERVLDSQWGHLTQAESLFNGHCSQPRRSKINKSTMLNPDDRLPADLLTEIYAGNLTVREVGEPDPLLVANSDMMIDEYDLDMWEVLLRSETHLQGPLPQRIAEHLGYATWVTDDMGNLFLGVTKDFVQEYGVDGQQSVHTTPDMDVQQSQ